MWGPTPRPEPSKALVRAGRQRLTPEPASVLRGGGDRWRQPQAPFPDRAGPCLPSRVFGLGTVPQGHGPMCRDVLRRCSWDGLSRGQGRPGAGPWHRNPVPKSAVPRLGDPSAQTESGAPRACEGLHPRVLLCGSLFFSSGPNPKKKNQGLVAPVAESSFPLLAFRAPGTLLTLLVKPRAGPVAVECGRLGLWLPVQPLSHCDLSGLFPSP